MMHGQNHIKADKVDKQGEELWNFVFFHKICNSAFITLLLFLLASSFKILATFLMMKALSHQYYNIQFFLNRL